MPTPSTRTRCSWCSNLRRLAMPQFDHELPKLSRHHAAAAEARDRLPRRAVPRHRQGPRRRPLRARRGRRRGVLPRAGPVALRRAPGRLAGAQPPAAVGHRAEEGHRRSGGDQRLRARGGRPGAPRLPLPADRAPTCAAPIRSCGTPGRPRCSTSSTSACSARCAAASRARSTKSELVAENAGRRARAAGARRASTPRDVERAWAPLSTAYFLRHSPEEIAWHTRLLADARSGRPMSRWWPCSRAAERGGNAVLIYAPHRQHSFARTTAVLDQLGLNIVDARITPLEDGFSLDIYHVLEDNGAPIADRRARRTRSSSRCGARCSGRRTRPAGRDAPRAAPGAHVQHADADHHSPTTRATTARSSSWSPATGPGLLCEVGQGAAGRARRPAHGARIMHHRRARRGRVLRHRRAAASRWRGRAATQLQEQLIAALDRARRA